MAAAGGEHAVDVAFADRRAGDLDRGRDEFAGRASGGDRDDDGVELHSRGALGEVGALAHRGFRLGKIDHGARLHAAGKRVAKADDVDRMGAQAQHVLGRPRLEAPDQAGDLAGADIERGDEHRTVGRQRLHLRREAELEGAHALPPFFLRLVLGRVDARLRGRLREPHRHAIGQPEIDGDDIARDQVLFLVERDQPLQRGRDVGFRQPHVDAVLQPQVPAPFAHQDRGAHEGAQRRDSGRATRGIPLRASPRRVRPPAAARSGEARHRVRARCRRRR